MQSIFSAIFFRKQKRFALAYEAVRAFFDDCTLCTYNSDDIMDDLLLRPEYVLDCVRTNGHSFGYDTWGKSSFSEEEYYRYQTTLTRLKNYIEGLN